MGNLAIIDSIKPSPAEEVWGG